METFTGQRKLKVGSTVELLFYYYRHDLFVKNSMRLWKIQCSFWSLQCVLGADKCVLSRAASAAIVHGLEFRKPVSVILLQERHQSSCNSYSLVRTFPLENFLASVCRRGVSWPFCICVPLCDRYLIFSRHFTVFVYFFRDFSRNPVLLKHCCGLINVEFRSQPLCYISLTLKLLPVIFFNWCNIICRPYRNL